MLIVSWNVAGLKPALQKIHTDYANDTTANARSSSKPSPFATYLALHGDISILCLQEHKIPLASLSSRSEPHQCSSVTGYESFWSCNTNAKSRGFNGVVTYAKVGMVRSADAFPLKDEELDSQGRCVMTNHGSWVLFNVYVPNGGMTPEGLVNKMRFLNALRRAMKRQRQEGMRVVLVGDMNAKIDKRDLYWRHRVLNIDDVLEQIRAIRRDDADCDIPPWKVDIERHWDTISSVCQTVEAIPCMTTNPTTKQTFNKFRARVKLPDGKNVMLGSNEDSAEEALESYSFDERFFVDPENGASTLIRKKNVLGIDSLAELMAKIANVKWDEKILRAIAESDEAGLNPDSPSYLWMKMLIEEDGMVDVFRHFYSEAEARQFTNKRYTNEGGRIDFTFVDKPLLEFVDKGDNQTLRCGKESHDNPLGEEAALMAATANGLFEPGTYAGGGIAIPTKRALDSQFGPPHTGMIYTPPSYSDHIAISLFMKSSFDELTGTLTLDWKDSATRKSQPHKKQRSIASFLCASAPKQSDSSGVFTSLNDKKRLMPSDNAATKKKTLASYFGNSNMSNIGPRSASSHSRTKSASTHGKKIPQNNILNHFKK
ncbi:hypothetical protein HJC23_003953 [Cyclotella cryptica]|uniref:Endonuclease/exonuclease/phosphatase domain-containing protein n=1 Tax=Cyclotella cryptica TaxID=29204 RepID=A0ABD3PVA4_9STRA